jgi:signal transduction histidine kinase
LPDPGQLGLVVLELAALLEAVVLVTAVTVWAMAALRRSRRQAAGLIAIEFVRARFAARLAGGVSLEELLPQVVRVLRDTFVLDAAEVWVAGVGGLTLAASEPARPSRRLRLVNVEEAALIGTPVADTTWARVWLPDLMAGRPEATLRIAPMRQFGELLGLIVVERAGRRRHLAAETDATLEELAREIGFALHRTALDSALQESLDRLRRQAEALQASRARIVSAADAERQRIERDLHDGAQQYLVALAVKARIVQRLVERDPARARTVSGELASDVERAIAELRDLAHGIYPPLLSVGGLMAALAVACRCSGVAASMETEGVRRYPAELEAAVYFCCVEALQNVAKHAGARTAVIVRVHETCGQLQFEITDNGVGFTPNGSRPGSGLTNMGDRLGAVGGSFELESSPGSGTTIRGHVPVSYD